MRKNKNKKIILVINIILIIVIVILILGYLLIFKNNINNTKERLSINKIITIPEVNISVGDSFYIKEDNNNINIYDFNNNKLYEYQKNDTYYEIFNNKYIIIRNNDNTLVIDKKGKEINKGTFSITINNNDINYLIIDNKVYNNNMEEVYTLSSNLTKDNYIGSKLYGCFINNNVLGLTFEDKDNNVLIDLNTKKVLYSGFDDYLSLSEKGDSRYMIIKDKDKYNLFDTVNKDIIINNINLDENSNISKDNKTIYIYNDKIYQDNTKIGKKYHMSSSNCTVGSKLLDKKNNIVIDKCMLYYEEIFNNTILGTNFNESILYINNNIITGDNILNVGEYFEVLNYKNNTTESKIYNKNGKLQKLNKEIIYLGNNYYQAYNPDNQSYSILDDKLNIVEDNIGSINYFNDSYFVVSDDNHNKYLYRDGKKISSNIYNDITVNNDTVVGETLFNTYIYILGEDKEINIDVDETPDINIEEIINKYDLNIEENKLKENEKLFKKYAYIVENNDNLLDYKKEVMNIFNLIIDNKNYLSELGLLKKLKELNIIYSDSLGFGVGATYTDGEVKVSLKDKNDFTLYHELTHFIDFSFNNNSYLYNLYNCDGNYIVKKGYDNRCTPINIETNFITEAGAEVYSGKYFTNELEAYSPAPLILEALEYIYGSDEVNEWFFVSDNYFKKIWFDMGYSEEEVLKIINSLSNTTKVVQSGSDDTLFIIDLLIDSYKYKKNSNFMNDNKFKYILRSLINYQADFTTSKYKEELNTIIQENNNITSVLNNTFKDYALYKKFGDLIIIDNKEYISSLCYKNEEAGSLLIDYDFDNNKVIDYKYIKRNG